MGDLGILAAGSGSQPTVREPFTLIFMALAFVGLVVTAGALWSKRGLSAERRIFWCGVLVSGVSAFIAALLNWKVGIGLLLLLVVGWCVAACFGTSVIKVGGNVHAFDIDESAAESGLLSDDGRPSGDPERDPYPDAYGYGATAVKVWWAMVGVVLVCAGNVVMSVLTARVDWISYAAAGALVVYALGLGYGDASWSYRVARGQYFQFALAGILSAGTFTALYLAAYAAGRRWPLRRKESLEYRTHPRHRKEVL
ncbi:hypothetical protein [Mycobacterium sp. SA01]|uniref:hypothetical protein n=1 Tax=Mycobacterium sp. SA01 TaxID=3238820 RepID=UPI00351B0A34